MIYTYGIAIAGLVWIDPKDNPLEIATIIGVTSWSSSCGDDEYPPVFGKVTQVLDWIQDTTSKYIKRVLY